MIAVKNIKTIDIIKGIVYLGIIAVMLFSPIKNWWVFSLFCLMFAYTILKYVTPHLKIFKSDVRKPAVDFLNSYGPFEYTTDRFINLNDRGSSFYWDEINRIVAYKVDLLAVDSICLLIEREKGKAFMINEEDEGWYQFILAIQKRFSIDEGWLAKVAHPPFARNETILYEKA
jgi:hypothetical protein